jgi:hypothetical protein
MTLPTARILIAGARSKYDADATQATGEETLRDHYARILRSKTPGDDLGAHRLF